MDRRGDRTGPGKAGTSPSPCLALDLRRVTCRPMWYTFVASELETALFAFVYKGYFPRTYYISPALLHCIDHIQLRSHW